MRQLTILCFVLFSTSLFAQNQIPVVSNLTLDFDESNQTLTATYNLFDAESESMDVHFLVSDDGGISYLINTSNATGDLGSGILSGTDKSISWDASGLLNGIGDYRVKIVADDLFQLDVQEIVDQVDSNRILANLEFIEGIRHRNVNVSHLEAVKDTIEQRFVDANLETVREDFPYSGYTAQNIIGSLEGSLHSDSTYIIDGHFDTVDDSPGADDNGSAIAGLLEAARVLAPYQYNKTLRFIGFDLEEEGLLGAFNYTAEDIPDREIIKGVFNLEMIGYYTEEPNTQAFPAGFELLYPDVQAELEADDFRGNFITNIGDQNSIPLMEAYDEAAANYVPELKVISIAAPESWTVLTPDFGRSDHAAFWLSNRPALMLTDGSEFRNPYYHSPNDLLETLDFTFMSNVVKAVVGAVIDEAGIQHSSFTTAEFSVLTSAKNTLDCGLNLSPIPTDNELNLHFENCAFATLEVQVFDPLGKLVLSKSISPTASDVVKLDLNQLEAGLFLLRISDGERSLSRKVLKR